MRGTIEPTGVQYPMGQGLTMNVRLSLGMIVETQMDSCRFRQSCRPFSGAVVSGPLSAICKPVAGHCRVHTGSPTAKQQPGKQHLRNTPWLISIRGQQFLHSVQLGDQTNSLVIFLSSLGFHSPPFLPECPPTSIDFRGYRI